MVTIAQRRTPIPLPAGEGLLAPHFDADRVASRGASVACRYRRQCAFLHAALGDIVLRCLPSAVTMRRKPLCCPARHFGVIMANAPRNRRPRMRPRSGRAVVI